MSFGLKHKVPQGVRLSPSPWEMAGAQEYLLGEFRSLNIYSQDNEDSKGGTSLMTFALVSTSVGSQPSGRPSDEMEGVLTGRLEVRSDSFLLISHVVSWMAVRFGLDQWVSISPWGHLTISEDGFG